MERLDDIFKVVLDATISTGWIIGLELGIYPDKSSSMYGENVLYVLIDGEVEEEFFFLDDAIRFLKNMRN